MKNLLSRISKKSVALLVAVALVLTSVATIVVASADTPERYTVTAKDPVVPMTAGYSVNLADFDIEGEDSTALTLDGSVDAADIEIVDGVIKAYKRGVYKATAGDMTVYIVVKAPNETEYVLYENDYREYTADEVSDWKTVFAQYNGTSIGTLAATDNRKSANSYTEEDALNNPALHTYATTEEKLNRLARNSMPVGFMPYDPNTLFWYDAEAFAALEQAELDAGVAGTATGTDADGVIGSPYNYTFFRFQKDNATKKTLNPYGYPGYAVTILENDTIAAFQNYKVTASIRMRAGYYGGVGIAGRISDAADNFSLKNGSTVSTAVMARGYWKTGVAVLNADNTSSMVTTAGKQNTAAVSGLATRLYDNLNYNNANNIVLHDSLRVYEYDYNGDSLTISSPDISTTEEDNATVTLQSTANPGYIGFFTVIGWKDYLNTDSNKYTNYYSSVPCVLDVKVTLNDSVDASLLPTTKMDDVNAAEKVFGTEDYVDNNNWYAFYTEKEKVDGKETGNILKYDNLLQYGYMLRDVEPTDNTLAYSNCLDLTNKSKWANKNVKYVGRYLLRNGENHTGYVLKHSIGQVKLPDVVYHINDSAFNDAANLEKINLDGHLESLGEAALNGSGIKEAIFSDNLISIGKGALSGCYSLTRVDLGNRVTTIGTRAFANCTLLSEITLPASVTTLGAPDNYGSIFTGCKALTKVYVYNPDLDITNCGIDKTITTIYAKEGSLCATTAAAAGYTVKYLDSAVVDKAVSDYNKQESQFTSIKVPAKANIDLTKLTFRSNDGGALSGDQTGVIVEGSDNVTFSIENTDVANGAFTIADGILTTGAEKATGLTFTAVYRGSRSSERRTTVLNLEIVDEAETNLLDGQYELLPPEPSIEVTADDENELTYIATVDPANKTLIPNSLVALDNGKEVKVLTPYGTSGKAFAFQAVTPNATVTAQYTTENIQDDIFYLGASIRAAGSGKTAGIKFGNRLPAIKFDGENITSDTITLDDGTTATVNAIGTLVIPSVLLRDAELKIPADQEASFDANEAEVVLGELNGQSALNIKHQTVTAYTEDFSDVKAILGGLDQLGLTEEQYKALKISAITYIQYTDANDEIGYSYGELVEKSYNDVYDVIYPEYATGAEYLNLYLQPSADGDYVYNDSEEIVITYSVAPGYRSYWNVQIKDGEGYEAGWDYRFATGTVDSTNIVKVVVPAEKTQVKEYRTYFAIRRQDETGEWHTFVNAIPGPTFSVVAD